MIELIPAIDIIDGKCVRLTQGDYARKTIYGEDPVEVAKSFADCGIRRLHVVDLDGARSKHIVNARTIERITTATTLSVDFGGGIKSDTDLQTAFDAGAQMVTIGSLAVTEPDTMLRWMSTFGCERLILGADIRNGRISIHGWQEEGNEQLLPFIRRYHEAGIRQVLCTDIARDGMLQGPNTALYRSVMETFAGLHLIASGGVGSLDDIRALAAAGVPAVVIGKAIYEGRIPLPELASFAATQPSNIRTSC